MRVARRWQEIDPLLPVPHPRPSTCGAEFTVTGPDGQLTATASCEHWVGDPESLDISWGAARRFQLSPRIAGPDVAGALDGLLAQWHGHLADLPGADEEDTAAVVDWPSRDVGGIKPLLRHGFAPIDVIAARTARRQPPGAAAPAAGAEGPVAGADGPVAGAAAGVARPVAGADGPVAGADGPVAGADGPVAGADGPVAGADGAAGPGPVVRRARPADVDEVARLGLEVVRFDAHFGGVTERPGTAAAMRREAAGLLAGGEPWTWLAERDGTTVGLLEAQRPVDAGWIAAMARPRPLAYLVLMFVAPSERSSGVGRALTARFHQDAAAAGVAVTLLHYGQSNPLSAPFWSQQGYRPLWTSWAARPASTTR